jgi:hypothetical protein
VCVVEIDLISTKSNRFSVANLRKISLIACLILSSIINLPRAFNLEKEEGLLIGNVADTRNGEI